MGTATKARSSISIAGFQHLHRFFGLPDADAVFNPGGVFAFPGHNTVVMQPVSRFAPERLGLHIASSIEDRGELEALIEMLAPISFNSFGGPHIIATTQGENDSRPMIWRVDKTGALVKKRSRHEPAISVRDAELLRTYLSGCPNAHHCAR